MKWPWELPQTVVIRWTGNEYEEAIATYRVEAQAEPIGEKIAGIDLGEVHQAVAFDGERVLLLNGRLLRSKRQYHNKLKATLQANIDVKKKGSRRQKKLVRSKQKQLRKLNNQIKDVEHQQTRRLITTLHQAGVRTLVIGDVRDIRQDNDVGSANNQKLHQWSHGRTRHMLTYKAERAAWNERRLARRKLHEQDMPSVWASAHECGARAAVPLSCVPVDLSA